MFNWIEDGLTYKPADMNAGTSRLEDYRLSDWNSASNNFCLTLTVRYVITILAGLVRGEPTYTSSNRRIESTLSGSNTNIASNSLTSSSNVGLCIGDSCQHFNIIWYLRTEARKTQNTHNMFLNTTGCLFFWFFHLPLAHLQKCTLFAPNVCKSIAFNFSWDSERVVAAIRDLIIYVLNSWKRGCGSRDHVAASFILHLYTFQFESTSIFCWLSYFGLGWDSFFHSPR